VPPHFHAPPAGRGRPPSPVRNALGYAPDCVGNIRGRACEFREWFVTVSIKCPRGHISPALWPVLVKRTTSIRLRNCFRWNVTLAKRQGESGNCDTKFRQKKKKKKNGGPAWQWRAQRENARGVRLRVGRGPSRPWWDTNTNNAPE
jgi:hypothetical protein